MQISLQLSGERDDTGAVVFQSEPHPKLKQFKMSVPMDAWRKMGEPMQLAVRAQPAKTPSVHLRSHGWWHCGCEKSCKCGGTPKKLNPPDLGSCAACGARKP